MKEASPFKDLKVDHLAFLCKDLQSSYFLNFYKQLSWELFHEEILPAEGVAVMLLSSPLENFYIELISPLNNESPLQKALIKRGEGFHHICYKVNDLDTKMLDLQKLGIDLLPNYPRRGSRNKRICFLNPSKTGKILVELAESPH